MDMQTAKAENLDLFVNAQLQFERALTWIDDLKAGIVDYLINPNRTIHVRFPDPYGRWVNSDFPWFSSPAQSCARTGQGWNSLSP